MQFICLWHWGFQICNILHCKNFSFTLNEKVLMKKPVDFFLTMSLSNIMNVTFTFWLDWYSYQLIFFSFWNYTYLLLFTFPFFFDWDFYQFFSSSKYTQRQLYTEGLIDILINNCVIGQFDFDLTLIFLSIIDININKIAFCSSKVWFCR